MWQLFLWFSNNLFSLLCFSSFFPYHTFKVYSFIQQTFSQRITSTCQVLCWVFRCQGKATYTSYVCGHHLVLNTDRQGGLLQHDKIKGSVTETSRGFCGRSGEPISDLQVVRMYNCLNALFPHDGKTHSKLGLHQLWNKVSEKSLGALKDSDKVCRRRKKNYVRITTLTSFQISPSE